MTRRRSGVAQLEEQIERLYYQHAQGRQIDILKIGKIFEAGRMAHTTGQNLEEAIIQAIAQHTEAA